MGRWEKGKAQRAKGIGKGWNVGTWEGGKVGEGQSAKGKGHRAKGKGHRAKGIGQRAKGRARSFFESELYFFCFFNRFMIFMVNIFLFSFNTPCASCASW